MPNGIENQSYEFKFQKQPGKKYIHSSNLEFNSAGLEITEDNNYFYIKGDKLKNPGDHIFQINEVGLFAKQSTLKLFINKDPKSLWNVLEPDPKERAINDKSHSHAELQETQLLRIVGASLRGRSHAHEGKFREDDFKIHVEPDGVIVVAVSDGAGSAKYSRIGSYHVCEEGVKHVVKHFNDKRLELEPLLEAYAEGKLSDSEKQKLNSIPQILIESGLHVSKILNEVLPAQYQAKHPDIKFQSKDFSATYLIGLLIPMKGKYILCTFWAGDGGIGFLHKETNKVECLGIPDGGEFSGQTLFVNSSSVFANNEYLYKTRVQFRPLDDFTTILLMSDGVTDPKFGTDSELKNLEKWKSLWSEMEPHIYSADPRENLLKWLEFWSQGNYDDRTFISISKIR
jgi:serine/threonine protein phosphatase PrpC